MKPIKIKSLIAVLLLSIQFGIAQQLLTQNVTSVGGRVSTGTNIRLISVAGQPIAYNGTGTEPRAGFLHAAPYLITDTQAPVILVGTLPTLTRGLAATLSATITDNIAVRSPKLFYKSITSPKASFTSSDLNAGTNNTFSVQVANSVFDNDMGLEYYFQAKDDANNITPTPASGSYLYLSLPSTQVPAAVLSAGSTSSNYRIITIPYISDGGEAITNVFGTSSGLPAHKSDKTVWRLATYNSTSKQFEEYPNLPNFERGKGYWFLVRNSVPITLGTRATPPNNRTSLFKIKLKPGWNMIGNPYPVAIKWSDVQNFVGNEPAKTFPLNVYKGGWSTETDLAAFQGGFVKNTTNAEIEISIPFSGQTAIGGRAESEIGTDISVGAWQVPMHIFQGEAFNKLGAFGMVPTLKEANEFSGFNPPAFDTAPEINFEEAGLSKLCKQITLRAAQKIWRFKASGTVGQTTELHWTNQLGSGTETLYILDEVNLKLINMRVEDRYDFTLTSDHAFTLFYGVAADKILPQKISISSPYPNPITNRSTSFIVGLPESTESFDVGFQLFSATGIAIHNEIKALPSGIHPLLWQPGNELTAGVYYYRIQVRAAQGVQVATGKLIVQ